MLYFTMNRHTGQDVRNNLRSSEPGPIDPEVERFSRRMREVCGLTESGNDQVPLFRFRTDRGHVQAWPSQ